jgi:hypothetical protein
MQIIGLIFIAVAAVLFGAGSSWLAARERKERKEVEKELREARENEQKAADIITEANETKQDANSGDIDNDLNFMAGKLHDYAKK